MARPLGVGALTLATAVTGLTVFAGAATAAPTDRYVARTGTDTGACTVASTPCKTIGYAVGKAAAGDTVVIAKGTYAESVTVDKTLTLQGDPGGGTVLSGIEDNPALQLIGGNRQSPPPAISLENLDISGNKQAPGVVATSVAVRLLNSHADRNLGGVIAGGSLVVLDGSTASGNTTSGTEGVTGAGVVSFAGVVDISESTISGNDAVGVAALNNFGPPGSTPTPPADDDADTTITDSTVAGNGFYGVGSQGGSMDVDSSTITGNGSFGVFSSASAVTVRNSTVALTRGAALPGGVENLTPAGLGTLPATGGQQARAAQRVLGMTRATTTLRVGERTLTLRPTAQRRVAAAAAVGITVSGSALEQRPGVPDCAGVTDGGYNASADKTNSCGFTAASNDLVRTDPKLGALADNGGPTRTHLPQAGSPLRNAIPLGRADCERDATDQRGVAKPQGPRCDIGAVEVVPAKAAPVVITTRKLPSGEVGEKYRKQLLATGGDEKYGWSLAKGALPPGLALSRTGVLAGVPTKAGSYTFTVLADGASRTFTVTVGAAQAAPNGNGQDPIAATGAPSQSLLGWGAALVLSGFAVLLAAGRVGRRPGRHRG